MDRKNILEMMEHMERLASEVGLQVDTKEEQEGQFIKILLKDKNDIVYGAYETSTIIGFIHGIQSNYSIQ